MTVRADPEQNETRALFGFVDLDGRRVLEIGSGDGRLTWRYADRAAHVTAVEPFAPAVARAKENVAAGANGSSATGRKPAFTDRPDEWIGPYSAHPPGRQPVL